jgi:anti-sigma factor RsiW
MSCENFSADLSAWIDGELPDARAAEVAAHVAACAICTAEVGALRRADAALRAIPLRELAPGALAEVLRRADRATPRVARIRVLRWVAAPVAAAAGLALYLALRPDPLDAELADASPEDLAVAIDLDTAEDLEVIANLELLEKVVALDKGRG